MPYDILEDYNPVQESGNAFIFTVENHWKCFASLVRALETFRFPYDWRTIQRHAMDTMDRQEALQAV
jgi:glycogen synthase